jgi:hypothetical protein
MQKRIRIECGLDRNLEQDFGQMIEPEYVPYEQYRATKTRCGLDSRIYGTSFSNNKVINHITLHGALKHTYTLHSRHRCDIHLYI